MSRCYHTETQINKKVCDSEIDSLRKTWHLLNLPKGSKGIGYR